MYIKLILSKKLAINKCTLLDCTNTEILMYCIIVYTDSTTIQSPFTHAHSFSTDTQT